ncbi:Flp pilus assembly protein CpaB [Pseudarthrobacter raffinosi]|uniref:Flp pilus assembly protein CpaB n=1 Tax=Pseudarthrobacter raffinosi TaxID=2953651 RepID=UPI00208F0420|nr:MULTISPECIES: Flp pilus assembly protein CpaB [unclassified Pseudarthrobacter]MCO4236034.1 Flp pilus assembly protein CpaB [Pseudarthrobacter sp. MDT3-28]MCO4253309.1 Flp pilus assembly protein CpaB [Pseudarthrobacter sp. MDT3-9]
MKTRLLGGIVALVLALVGTLLLVSYVQGSEARAQEDLKPVEVLVIQEQIPQGSDLEEIKAAVKLTSLPSASVPNGALKSLEGLNGKVAAVELLPGEPLLGVRLADPSSLSAPGSVPVPEGMQEVSVQLEAERAVGGRIAAGDTVGIVVLFDKGALKDSPELESGQQVFHKVLVTSVQRPLSEAPAEPKATDAAEQSNTALPTGQMIVTFARNDADSAKIAFGAHFGTLWLTKEPSTATEGAPVVVKKPELYR